jgi:hypothetical protein
MRRTKETLKATAAIPASLKSWIHNVIAPAILKQFLDQEHLKNGDSRG